MRPCVAKAFRGWILFSLCLIFGTWTSALAWEKEPKFIPENFIFSTHNSDIFQWQAGHDRRTLPNRKGEVARALKQTLDSAQESIKLALYGVKDQEWFFSTLSNAVARQVRVRMVVDQRAGAYQEWIPQNFTYSDTPRLARKLLPGKLVPDLNRDATPRASTIMHNKFAVVDRQSLWFGTANLSANCLGAEYNANTSIILQSPPLAEIYAEEFEQMHQERRFSVHKKVRLDRRPRLFADGTLVRIYFSPQDQTIERGILPWIDSIERSLDIGMFFLTDEAVAKSIVRAKKRGVRVRLIYDGLAAGHSSSRQRYLAAHGIDVRVENWGGRMHMKTAIADGRDVVIGSMNWSASGNRSNDENTMIIQNNCRLASELGSYFEQLWQSLSPPASSKGNAKHENENYFHDFCA